MWHSSIEALPSVFNPLSQLLKRYEYKIQFVERPSSRFLDVHVAMGDEWDSQSTLQDTEDTDYQPSE